MRYLGASVSGTIAASAEAIWELVGDPTRHPEIAGSGEVQDVEIVGGGPITLGAVFQSQQNMHGLRYTTANRVVIWDAPYRFAWRVGAPFLPGVAQTWVFNLTPTAGGTLVENGVALPYPVPTFFPFSMLHEDMGRREVLAIKPTLFRLAEMLGAPPPSNIVERNTPPALAVAQLPPPALLGAATIGAVGAALLALSRVRKR